MRVVRVAKGGEMEEVKKQLGTAEVWPETGTVRGVGLVRMAKGGGEMKRLGTPGG